MDIRFKQYKIIDYLIILIVLLIAFWQLVLGKASMKWDIVDIYLPWKFFITETLKSGNLPLWNPSINAGFPQMGDPGTWYPVSWIVGLFGQYNFNSLHFEYLLHLYIAGIGFNLFATQKKFSRKTSLIISIAYMLSGFFISNAQHIGWLISAAWLPFVALFYIQLLKKPNTSNSLKLGFTAFLMFTGGYPGIFISTFYIVLFHLIYKTIQQISKNKFIWLKKQLPYLTLAAISFILFSLPAIASSCDISKYITRGDGLEYNNNAWGILTGSLPINSLITFFLPFSAAKNDLQFWGGDFSLLNSYFSIFLLILALSSITNKALRTETTPYIFIGLLFLVTAMAEIFPFRRILLILPMMDLFRFSSLFRVFTIFSFLIAAGFSIDYFLFDKLNNAKLKKLLISIIFILSLSGTTLFFFIEKWKFLKIFSEGWLSFLNLSEINERIFLQIFVFGVLSFSLYLFSMKVKKINRLKNILGIAIIIDLVIATQLNLYSTVVSEQKTDEVNEYISNLSSNPTPSLTMSMKDFNDNKLSHSIPYLWKNLATYFKLPSCDGVSPYALKDLKSSYINGDFNFIENKPFVFFSSRIEERSKVDSNKVSLLDTVSTNFNLFSPNYIKLSTSIKEDGYLIIAQNHYPYWNAYTDSKKVEILKVNSTFMAIPLKSETKVIELKFSPDYIIYFALFSVIIWVIYIFLLMTNIIISIRKSYLLKTHSVSLDKSSLNE